MSKALKLQLVTSDASPVTIEFDVEGQLLPRWVPVYTSGGSPRQIVSLNLEWKIAGARVQAADAATLWGASAPLGKLLTAIKTRGTGQISAVYLKNAAGTTIDSFTSSVYRNIVVSSVEGFPDPTLPQEAWDKSAFLTITVSAEKLNTTGSAGIVSFEQKIIDETDSAGLRHLTWLTTMEVDYGYDVRTVARTYARIPDASVTGTYAWQTNSTDGVDITTTDADESVTARTPTKAVCFSKINQFGVAVNATTAGGSPGAVEYSVTTESGPTRNKITTVARAVGPNAQAWVEGNGHAPTTYTSEVILSDAAKKEYSHTWIYEVGVETTIRLEIEGGYQPERYEGLAAAFYPMIFKGAFKEMKATLYVTLRKTSIARPARGVMTFPGPLPAPWRLDRSAVWETPPYQIKDGEWERQLRAPFTSPYVPIDSKNVEDQLAAAGQVDSYKFGTFGGGNNNELGGIGNLNG